MKTSDFMKEDTSIVANVHEMHKDHEVQMAREECYNIASNAIELHKLLKHMSETTGLDGWVSEKISLANDYMKTVCDFLKYEAMTGSTNSVAQIGEDTSSSCIATAPAKPNVLAGGLFGGGYQQPNNPFKKKNKVIKRTR